MTSKEFVSLGLALFLFLSAAGGVFIWWKKPFSVKPGPTIAHAQQKTIERNNEPYKVLTQASPLESLPSGQATVPPTPATISEPPVRLAGGPSMSSLPTPALVYVKSVVIGKKANTAVLAQGSDEISVREKTNSKFGYISSITKDGVTIDDRFISIKDQPKDASSASNVPPISGQAFNSYGPGPSAGGK